MVDFWMYLMKVQKIGVLKAGRLKRLLAFIIDLFVLEFIVLLPFGSLLRRIFPDKFGFGVIVEGVVAKKFALILIVIGIVALLYFALFEYKLRQSIGKMALNIYVISEYKELRLWQAIVRNILFVPIFPFNILPIIDAIFFLFKNRRFSEIITKTDTVEAVGK